MARTGAGCARLPGQKRLSWRHPRPVGRHRLGAGAGDIRGCTGQGPRSHGHDALALHRRHFLDRRARHGRAPWRALRRDRYRAAVRGLQGQPGNRVRRSARGHNRRKPAGAHPGHLAHGLVQQVRQHRADHRQQERNGHRLLHAVRRHGRWLCSDQGCGQDHGFQAGPLAQCTRPIWHRRQPDSRAHHRAPAQRRAAP